jgi:predicted RecB family endonuclease
MPLYECGFRNGVALLAAGCVWLMSLALAGAEDSSIQSIIERISTQASELSDAARGAQPIVDDVAHKALNLSTTMAKLDPATERQPDQASSHADALKRLAADEINLGTAITSLSDADAGTAKKLIANVAAIADDIKADASAY